MEGRIEDTLLQNQINAAGGGGGTPLITSQDETPVVAATTTMEYQGDGVTVTAGDSGIAIVNIPGGGGKTGFSPVNLGSSDTSFAFDATTKWGVIFLTKVEENMSLDNITIYGVDQESQPDPADGVIEIMIYNWGTGWNSAGSTKKCGGTLATCGYGPNEISLVAEPAQSLEVAAGENIMIAIRKTSGTFDAVAASCRTDKMYSQTPNPEIGLPAVAFPALTPDTDVANVNWNGAGYAPACTLWENPS